ncbi:MAG: AAA family ATPase [Planctomycetaceae bacterium]|nr:AAA family ATPase [Planctomycetaceae bacterium]
MIIRFTAKNIFSFKAETEFQMFPNKASQLPHHKFNVGEYEILRFSTIYGANGAGKSNLIKSINLLKSFATKGKITAEVKTLKFKLDQLCLTEPISLAIEFYSNLRVFYYTITFDENGILYEYLAETTKKEDLLIFERTIENGIQNIQLNLSGNDEKKKYFAEFVAKSVAHYELLLTYLSKKFPDDFATVKQAYSWFINQLVVITVRTEAKGITKLLASNTKTKEFINKFISSLNTGINQLEVKKVERNYFNQEDINKIVADLKNRKPNTWTIFTCHETGELLTLSLENGEVVIRKLTANHVSNTGEHVEFGLEQESDGTKRLIDYIPALEKIINKEIVCLIDEIERSIHPLTIKEMIKKLSWNENMKGQLIFTTHESYLLDQKIFRPDEIWFVQKDKDGSSRFYSLSDYKINHSVDIENGYLNGRFGGIPFLSNLKDLNWQ